MAGVNKVILVGNVGKIETRFTPDGKPVTNLSLATSESWKDKSTGQRQEKTEWHKVVLFGGVAGIAEKYVNKGSKLYLEGKLTTRKWQDQSGQDKYTTEVVVDGFSGTMQILDSSQNTNQQPAQSQQQQAPQQNNVSQSAPQNNAPGGPLTDEFDDDIPFAQHERFLL